MVVTSIVPLSYSIDISQRFLVVVYVGALVPSSSVSAPFVSLDASLFFSLVLSVLLEFTDLLVLPGFPFLPLKSVLHSTDFVISGCIIWECRFAWNPALFRSAVNRL